MLTINVCWFTNSMPVRQSLKIKMVVALRGNKLNMDIFEMLVKTSISQITDIFMEDAEGFQ